VKYRKKFSLRPMGTVKIEASGDEISVRTLSLDCGSRIEESSSICYA
jgi:hypothetical protein